MDEHEQSTEEPVRDVAMKIASGGAYADEDAERVAQAYIDTIGGSDG